MAIYMYFVHNPANRSDQNGIDSQEKQLQVVLRNSGLGNSPSRPAPLFPLVFCLMQKRAMEKPAPGSRSCVKRDVILSIEFFSN
jgi:hypothetical protein